jgi:hypothetical protein
VVSFSWLPARILYTCRLSFMHATCPAHLWLCVRKREKEAKYCCKHNVCVRMRASLPGATGSWYDYCGHAACVGRLDKWVRRYKSFFLPCNVLEQSVSLVNIKVYGRILIQKLWISPGNELQHFMNHKMTHPITEDSSFANVMSSQRTDWGLHLDVGDHTNIYSWKTRKEERDHVKDV